MNIKDQRKELGLTQRELAAAANVSLSTISRAERNLNVHQPDTIGKIGNALSYYADTAKSPEAESAIEKDQIGQEMAVGPSTLITTVTGMGHMENPDDLVGKKGLEAFDSMKKYWAVKAALYVKKYARLSTQWVVKPASADQKDMDIADFYQDQLESLPGSVTNFLLSMMTFLDYGYSIMEENYYYIKDGANKGKIGLSSIKSKKPHEIDFKLDQYSNIEYLIQTQFGQEVKLPTNKFLISTWQPEWENPYGTSDLKAAYTPWWQNDVIMRMQAMGLEKYVSPLLLGRYPPGTTRADIDALGELLEDIQFHTTATIQEGLEIEPITLEKGGSDVFTKAIDKRDTMIIRSLLIPDLMGFTDRATGSYALGKKQFDLFIGILWHLGRLIEEVIHEQLTIPFITWNFGNVEMPMFMFEPLTEESSEVKAKIMATLTQAGFLDPTDRDILEWAADYLDILPKPKSTASEMMQAALDFKEPFKFTSPDGKDLIEIEMLENAARFEMLDDAFERV